MARPSRSEEEKPLGSSSRLLPGMDAGSERPEKDGAMLASGLRGQIKEAKGQWQDKPLHVYAHTCTFEDVHVCSIRNHVTPML